MRLPPSVSKSGFHGLFPSYDAKEPCFFSNPLAGTGQRKYDSDVTYENAIADRSPAPPHYPVV